MADNILLFILFVEIGIYEFNKKFSYFFSNFIRSRTGVPIKGMVDGLQRGDDPTTIAMQALGTLNGNKWDNSVSNSCKSTFWT